MKKEVLLFLLFFLCLQCFSMKVSAEEQPTLPYYVSDVAGLLTEEQRTFLEETATRVSEKYACGVYLVTLPDYREYDSSARSYWDFSQSFYKRYNLGIGEEKNGILLIMSLEERDYSILAYGSRAHYAFTDYGKEVLESSFLDDFRSNDWYGGFQDYFRGCENLLQRAEDGNPLDVVFHESPEQAELSKEARVLIVFVPPLLIALIVCQSMKKGMAPVRQRSNADEYVVRETIPAGINLQVKRDIFLNRTVTRRVIPQNIDRDSHSGGGGTTVNSGGFSGHSGKF